MTQFRTFLVMLLSLGTLFCSAQYKSTSVLNEGNFHKISVETNGIHKLTPAFFSTIPDIGAINPKTISLFGNRGGTVPEVIADDRVDDLNEIPMMFVGNDDNVFSADEYFLFYGEGPRLLTYEDQENFKLENNYYELRNFYFINVNRAPTNFIRDVNLTGGQATVSQFDDYEKYDNDIVNLLGKNFGTQGSGKKWYGEEFSGDRRQSMIDKFDLKNIVDGSEMEFRVDMAVRSTSSSSIALHIGDAVSTTTVPSTSIFQAYSDYARHRSLLRTHTFSSSTGIPSIDIEVFSGASIYRSWLDFISMESRKHLIYEGTTFNFRRLGNGMANYQIQSNNSNIRVWNVHNPFNVQRLNGSYAGQKFSVTAPLGEELVAFDPTENFPTPAYNKKIEPQNIHGIMDAEYVLLYHKNFKEAAERLAEHRSSFDGLNVYLIDVETVFNEFAGGSKDPVAIRDFARMLFKRSGIFNYLCFMGDASYDYRGLDAELSKDNYIPCYQTDISLSPIRGFPSDDFYALLSDNEGGNLQGELDVAIGRLPVGSVQEANTVVNKLIAYDTDKSFHGDWKNNFILVGDDEDGNQHFNQSESLSSRINVDRPEFNLRKVYLDAFEQRSTTGDDRYPEAKQRLNDYMFQGALLVNYFGHGGPNGWAQERVLEIQDILSWTNAKRLPFFITATCTFTGYDDAGEKSGGELTFLNPNGGSIGLVSTTRAVGISSNERLVNSIFEFMYEKEDDQYLRMGEIVRRGKNLRRSDTLGENARKFALIGDPGFILSIPEYTAIVSQFQGQPAGSLSDTIHALDAVTFSGDILGFDGEIASDFNGTLQVKVMDKAKTNRTLENDSRSREATYKAYDAVIFKGSTTVVNGKFEVQFRVPKDIDYTYGRGRISLYASEPTSQKEASGYYDKFYIGGTSSEVLEDDIPPTIDLFLNNEFFVDGGVVGPDPVLIANVGDDLGINLSNTSIGHEMIAVLDGDLPNQIIMNDYYEAKPNSFTDGVITYPFTDLEDGEHTLRVRVWDVANNSAEKTITFIVEQGKINVLENITVSPNPATEDVQFGFTHQLSYAPVDVSIEIYDQFGRVVSEIQSAVTTGGNAIENVSWNRVGYHGQVLTPGVYYYKIMASATSASGDTESASAPGGKIVLID